MSASNMCDAFDSLRSQLARSSSVPFVVGSESGTSAAVCGCVRGASRREGMSSLDDVRDVALEIVQGRCYQVLSQRDRHQAVGSASPTRSTHVNNVRMRIQKTRYGDMRMYTSRNEDML